MAKTIIVNEKDEQIGLKDRKDIKKEDMYRVSALWITNSKGKSLMARRALTKKMTLENGAPRLQELLKKGIPMIQI